MVLVYRRHPDEVNEPFGWPLLLHHFQEILREIID